MMALSGHYCLENQVKHRCGQPLLLRLRVRGDQGSVDITQKGSLILATPHLQQYSLHFFADGVGQAATACPGCGVPLPDRMAGVGESFEFVEEADRISAPDPITFEGLSCRLHLISMRLR